MLDLSSLGAKPKVDDFFKQGLKCLFMTYVSELVRETKELIL